MPRFDRVVLATVLAMFPACGGGGGELGQGDVTANCDGFGAKCGITGIDHPIAVGATLPVTVDSALFGAATPELSLTSGRPSVLKVDGSNVTALHEGMAPLLISVAGTESVLDFTHVRAERADNLQFAIALADGTDLKELSVGIALVPNEYLWAEVAPFKGIAALVGRMPITWSSDSAAVTILKSGASNRVRIVARSGGIATVTATALGLSTTFTIEVVL
jgi:hypothetical protein